MLHIAFGKVREFCLCKLPGLAVSVCFKNKTELTFYRSPTVMTGFESPIPVTGRQGGNCQLLLGPHLAFYFTRSLSSVMLAGSSLTVEPSYVASLPRTEHTPPPQWLLWWNEWLRSSISAWGRRAAGRRSGGASALGSCLPYWTAFISALIPVSSFVKWR